MASGMGLRDARGGQHQQQEAAWANISFGAVGLSSTVNREAHRAGVRCGWRQALSGGSSKIDGGRSRGEQHQGTRKARRLSSCGVASCILSSPVLSCSPQKGPESRGFPRRVDTDATVRFAATDAAAYNGRLADIGASQERWGAGVSICLHLRGRDVPTASLLDGAGDRNDLLKRHLNFAIIALAQISGPSLCLLRAWPVWRSMEVNPQV
ncbi:hypothetical protein B0T16DRAFT_60783 [Cercophora newfieldiana]|uniref:Uncharacterized protein n=1 Tax=Cercophora newfieldiana TaxID=92897 RepID=A0AA40D1T8_9PEZI|nr:hypothetical protein B0T16DRAFT_60783 [Cercophora newfieldiana]